MQARRKSLAWLLALVYLALIVYGSLYPFRDWRNQGIAPWDYLAGSLPKHWSGFDVAINVAGYAPFGFLLSLAALRSYHPYWTKWPVILATIGAGGLSFLMEATQTYLPTRVASNADLVLNLLGAWLGAMLAWGTDLLGVIELWVRFKSRWFEPGSRDIMALLTTWPVALLFPTTVPFGLGQVVERLEAALAHLLGGTSFLNWVPMRDMDLQPMAQGSEVICVALGILVPCLLGYAVIRHISGRAAFLLILLMSGMATTVLAAAMNYGPEHAWDWLELTTQLGLIVTAVLCALLIMLPRRVCLVLALLGLMIFLSILNQAAMGAFYALTLETWEQGQFIRFQGLSQWINWLWPYVAVLVIVVRLSRTVTRS